MGGQKEGEHFVNCPHFGKRKPGSGTYVHTTAPTAAKKRSAFHRSLTLMKPVTKKRWEETRCNECTPTSALDISENRRLHSSHTYRCSF